MARVSKKNSITPLKSLTLAGSLLSVVSCSCSLIMASEKKDAAKKPDPNVLLSSGHFISIPFVSLCFLSDCLATTN